MKSKAPTLTYPDIQWLKVEFLPSLAEEVEKRLRKKLDHIATTLDTLAGDIKDKREAQELHTGDHARIDKRITHFEKHTHLPQFVD